MSDTLLDAGEGFGGFGEVVTATVAPPPPKRAPLTASVREHVAALARERAKRLKEPTFLYEPMPHQRQFHESTARFRLVRGCLAGETMIYDPLRCEHRRIDEIKGDSCVYAVDPANGGVVMTLANEPFLKGVDHLYRVSLTNGRSFVSTLDHRVLTDHGWRSVGQLCDSLPQSGVSHPQSTSGTDQSESPQGARRWWKTVRDSLAGCLSYLRSCGGRLRRALSSVQSHAPSPVCVPGCDGCAVSHVGGPACTAQCNHPYLRASRLSSRGEVPRFSVRFDASARHFVGAPYLLPHDGGQDGRQFAARLDRLLRTSVACPQQATPETDYPAYSRHASSERGTPVPDCTPCGRQSRDAEGFPEGAYEPLRLHSLATQISSIRYERTDKFYDLHVPYYNNYLCRGLAHHNSNRSGKTVSGAMEVGWFALNRHPYHQDRKQGRIWVVCASEDHLADTICPKLFEPNDKFRMIKDPATKEWRAFRQDSEWDRDNLHLSRPMPPIIDRRYFATRPSYITKNRGSFKQVKLKTGWEITFFLGGSTPPAGADVDYVWFDEEIGLLMWYTEMAARLLDRRGFLTWTCTPQVGGQALQNFHLLCEKHAEYEPERRMAEEFHLLLSDNKHVGEREKAELAEQYENDPDTYRVRILGEYLTDQHLVYPTFSKSRHCCPGFPIPQHWTRYCSVDPGHSVLAVTFYAVPPETTFTEVPAAAQAFDAEHRGHLYIVDELYIRQADALKFGLAMKEKVGSTSFEAFIIDWAGSRRTEMGGQTIRQQLADALARHSVESRRSGSDFLLGSDDVQPGLSAVRRWLNETTLDGRPKLQIFEGAAPNLVSELQRYHTKKTNGVWTDAPNQVNNHACDTLRYAAMHGLPWVKPPKKIARWSLRNLLRQQREKEEQAGMWLAATGGREGADD